MRWFFGSVRALVRGTEVIRPIRRRGHDPRVRVVPSAATLRDQPPAGQKIPRRARGRQLQLGGRRFSHVSDSGHFNAVGRWLS